MNMPRIPANRAERRLAKRHSLKVEQERSCGTCTACCITHGVPSLDKKEFERCAILSRSVQPGCSLYATRPKECRTWSCLWKKGLGEESDIPNVRGIVLDVGTDARVITAKEAFEGGFETAEPLLEKLSDKFVVVLVWPDGDKLIRGPTALIREIEK